jgi:hypothetical protein
MAKFMSNGGPKGPPHVSATVDVGDDARPNKRIVKAQTLNFLRKEVRPHKAYAELLEQRRHGTNWSDPKTEFIPRVGCKLFATTPGRRYRWSRRREANDAPLSWRSQEFLESCVLSANSRESAEVERKILCVRIAAQ